MSISTISKPKAEKVVNPPHTPIIQKFLKDSGLAVPSICFTRSPIINAPNTFTNKVGQGDKNEKICGSSGWFKGNNKMV